MQQESSKQLEKIVDFFFFFFNTNKYLDFPF